MSLSIGTTKSVYKTYIYLRSPLFALFTLHTSLFTKLSYAQCCIMCEVNRIRESIYKLQVPKGLSSQYTAAFPISADDRIEYDQTLFSQVCR